MNTASGTLKWIISSVLIYRAFKQDNIVKQLYWILFRPNMN